MELRAAFLYARGDSGAELGGGDCSDRADLELHTRLCDGGLVTRTPGAASPSDCDGDGDSVHVALRRERPGCYVCAGLQVAFTCLPGAPCGTLPLTLTVGGDTLAGFLRCVSSEDGTAVTYAVEVTHAVRDGSGLTPCRGYELVLVGHDHATQRPVCLGCTVPPGPASGCALDAAAGGFAPPAFPRTVSGRRGVLLLEPIDENTKVCGS